MTTQSEYLKALEDLMAITANGFNTDVVGVWAFDNNDTIRRALRIAHRLTQEPSEEVITILERSDLTAEEAYADMAAELLKEESENGVYSR